MPSCSSRLRPLSPTPTPASTRSVPNSPCAAASAPVSSGGAKTPMVADGSLVGAGGSGGAGGPGGAAATVAGADLAGAESHPAMNTKVKPRAKHVMSDRIRRLFVRDESRRKFLQNRYNRFQPI